MLPPERMKLKCQQRRYYNSYYPVQFPEIRFFHRALQEKLHLDLHAVTGIKTMGGRHFG